MSKPSKFSGAFLRCSNDKVREKKVMNLEKLRDFHKERTRRFAAMLRILQEQQHNKVKTKFRAEAAAKMENGPKGRKQRWPGHDSKICCETTAIIKKHPDAMKKQHGKFSIKKKLKDMKMKR